MTKTVNNIKIKTDNLNEVAPLYFMYGGQYQPQSAYISIDPEAETVSADYSSEIGNAMSADVFYDVILQVPVNPHVNGQALIDFLQSDKISGLLKTVIDGHKIEWNGGNYVGRLTEYAKATLDEIEHEAYEIECDAVWNAVDWYQRVDENGLAEQLGITAETTDDELEKMAEKELDEALEENTHVEHIEEYLMQIRDQIREQE